MTQQNVMIRPGVVQDSVNDLLGTSLSSLPHWPRVHVFDRARYPRPFMRDKLQPLPNPFVTGGAKKEDDEVEKIEITETTNPTVKIQYLERSIDFLRRQHQELLSSLHDEVDRLKKENKEMNFRLAMVQNTVPTNTGSLDFTEAYAKNFMTNISSNTESSSKMTKSSSSKAKEKDDALQEDKVQQLKILFLEAEVKEMRKTLREEQAENERLMRMIEQLTIEKSHPIQIQQRIIADDKEVAKPPLPPSHVFQNNHSNLETVESNTTSLPFGASVNPLVVHVAPHPPRPPTLRECEIIIKHLQQLNDKQSHELSQLKTDLRDVLYSDKWTPDAYLLAKAYIVDDEERELAERGKLPRVQLKQQNKKIPESAYTQKDGVALPAMKSALSSKLAERRRRTQILQKARFTDKEVLH